MYDIIQYYEVFIDTSKLFDNIFFKLIDSVL